MSMMCLKYRIILLIVIYRTRAHKNRRGDRCRIGIARLEIRQILRTDFGDTSPIVV